MNWGKPFEFIFKIASAFIHNFNDDSLIFVFLLCLHFKLLKKCHFFIAVFELAILSLTRQLMSLYIHSAFNIFIRVYWSFVSNNTGTTHLLHIHCIWLCKFMEIAVTLSCAIFHFSFSFQKSFPQFCEMCQRGDKFAQ